MARRRHTPEQIIRKVTEGQRLLAGGMELANVCRQFDIAESTWYRWFNRYGEMTTDDAKETAAVQSRERAVEETAGRSRTRYEQAIRTLDSHRDNQQALSVRYDWRWSDRSPVISTRFGTTIRQETTDDHLQSHVDLPGSL